MGRGWDVAQLVRASDPHAADAGSIPLVQQGIFFPESTLSADSCGVRTTPCQIACINICVHDKDPVVHVRIQWIMATQTNPACTINNKNNLMVVVTQAQWACCCSMEAWIYLHFINCNHNCHHNHSPFQTSPWQKSTCYTLPWQQDLVTPDHMLHIAMATRSCDQRPHDTHCHSNKILWPKSTCYTLPWQQDLVTTDHMLHIATATRFCGIVLNARVKQCHTSLLDCGWPQATLLGHLRPAQIHVVLLQPTKAQTSPGVLRNDGDSWFRDPLTSKIKTTSLHCSYVLQ